MRRNRILLLIVALQIIILPWAESSSLLRYYNNQDTIEVGRELDLFTGLSGKDTSAARLKLEKALSISEANNYYQGISRSASLLGSLYLGRFNLIKAEKYYREAYEASKKTGDKIREANSANNLGTIAEKNGDYSTAVSYYLYAYEIFDSLKHRQGISGTANNLGIIYYLLNETDKALDFLKLSSELKRELKDSISLVLTFQNIGNVFFDLWKYDSSKFYYQKCIDLSEMVDDPASAGKALNSLGVISMLENNYLEALKFFKRAVNKSTKANDFQNLSSIYDNLGLLNLNSGKHENAISYFDSSLSIAIKYGLKEEMRNSYEHKSMIYAKLKNYKDAFINLQNFQNLQNDFLKEKGSVAGIEALFIKQKQENKILSLEKEQEKRKTQAVILLALLVIMLLVAFLGFSIYRITQKSKNTRKLAELEKERFKAVIEAQEMERKRIAGDLHDSVGQMLSLTKLHLSEIMDASQDMLPEHGQMLERSVNIIDEACQEVRNISHNLMPGPLIRLGLNSAVKDLTRKINASKKMRVSYSSNLNNDRLNENVEISIYRIIQEIMSNIIKHSGASEIQMILNRQTGNKIKLTISDNGAGFDMNHLSNSSGIGWKNIHSRLAIIGGSMKVDSVLDKGTVINIDVNL